MLEADAVRTLILASGLPCDEKQRLTAWVDSVAPPVKVTATAERGRGLAHAEGVAPSRPLRRAERRRLEKQLEHQAAVDQWHGERKPLRGESEAIADYEFHHSDRV